MIGVYKITQKSTSKVYIGQSKNIFARWYQHVNAVDSLSFHEAYKKDPTDFIFEILRLTEDAADLDRLEKLYIRDYKANDPQYGFNATSGNGQIKEDKPIKMLYVGGSINRYMHSAHLKNIENKKILIIGNFKFCDTLSLYNKITIITDDYDFICEDAERIIKVLTDRELKGEINKMKSNNEKFDLIIANPPYNIGNAIINNCMDLAEESIVLMPFSKYKANNLYKHILDMELVDPKAFADATITSNLCVCKLLRKEINQTFEELELQTFDPQYREFYELNQKSPHQLPYVHGRYIELKSTEQLNRTFYISVRVNVDGVHHESALDVDANKGILSIDFLNADALKRKKTKAIPLSSIEFKSRKEADNIKRFWYNSTFLNNLIWGLHKTGGSCAAAIPNIDWSVDRDYEHLTYGELLQIMRKEASKK